MTISDLLTFLNSYAQRFGVPTQWQDTVSIAMYIFLIFLLGYLSMIISKKLIISGIYRWARRSEVTWDDVFYQRKVFNPLVFLAPIVLLRMSLIPFAEGYPKIVDFLDTIADIGMVCVVAYAIYKFNNALEYMFGTENSYRKVALRSMAQIFNILLLIVVSLVCVSVLTKVTFITLLGYLGAATAVVVLIFKDTILGFVTSIQVASSKTLKAGDWVEIPQYGADGELQEINLITSSVKNWDNTIVSVPTYALISSGVKNWDGMVQSGGRRIKRSIPINAISIKAISKDDLTKYSKFTNLGEFISKQNFTYVDTIDIWGKPTTEVYLGSDRISNLWMYMAYIRLYLDNHPNISHKFITMVRLLEGTPEGIPVEIYAFSSSIIWKEYEKIQSDIMSFLYSATPEFELLVFQRASQKLENLFVSPEDSQKLP